MRVVTLGGFGATAPVVNQNPQPYFAAYESRGVVGLADGLSADTRDPNKTLAMGLMIGAVAGAIAMHLYMKR